ncbi:MAG: hypothetical protein LBU15_00910 [Rickettsiales bacterium]|jgi:hypothetical protein|nr:hypothetical protein [Rickettsiales bacterium]
MTDTRIDFNNFSPDDEKNLVAVVNAGKVGDIPDKKLKNIPKKVFNFESSQVTGDQAEKRELREGFVAGLGVEQLDLLAETGEGGGFFSNGMKIHYLEVKYISPAVLEQLKPKTLSKFKPDQMASLTKEQLRHLTPDQVRELAKECIDTLLEHGGLQYLQGASLGVLCGRLKPNQMASLTNGQLECLTPDQAKELKEDCVNALIKNNRLQHLQGASLGALGAKIELNKDSSAVLTQFFSLVDNGKVGFLDAKVLNGLDIDGVLNLLGKERMARLSSQMTSEQFNSLGEKRIRALTALSSMSSVTFKGLRYDTLAKLTGEQFAGLSEGQLGLLTLEQARDLKKEHVDVLCRANRLHHLPSDVLRSLARGKKISGDELTEGQLGNLVKTGKLSLIPESIVTRKNGLQDIDSKLFASILNTKFDHGSSGDKNIQIDVNLSPASGLAPLEKYDTPMLTRADFREEVEQKIRMAVANEKWGAIVSNCVEWIATDKARVGTILDVLDNEMYLASRDVYGLIDTINMLMIKMPLDEDGGQRDYGRLMSTIESLVHVVKYDSADEYLSSIDAILLLVEDERLDPRLRTAIAEELVELNERFIAAYGGALDPSRDETFKLIRTKSKQIYMRQAEALAERYEIDIIKLEEKLERLKKDLKAEDREKDMFNELSSFTSPEIQFLGAVVAAQEIDSGKGDGSDLSFYIHGSMGIIRSLAANNAVASIVKKITGSSALGRLVGGMTGVAEEGKKFANQKDIREYMTNEEVRKTKHKDDRAKSYRKEAGILPRLYYRTIFFVRGIPWNIRSFFLRAIGKNFEEKIDRGFKRHSYATLKNKENIKSGCQSFRRATLKNMRGTALEATKDSYLKSLGQLSEDALESAKTDDTGNGRKIREFVSELTEMRKKLLEFFLARKGVELLKDFPKIIRDGKTIELSTVGAIIEIASLSKFGQKISPAAIRNVEKDLAEMNINIGVLDSAQKIAFIERIRTIRRVYRTYQIRTEEEKADRIARANGAFRERLEYIREGFEEKRVNILKSLGKDLIDSNADEAIDLSDINISSPKAEDGGKFTSPRNPNNSLPRSELERIHRASESMTSQTGHEKNELAKS